MIVGLIIGSGIFEVTGVVSSNLPNATWLIGFLCLGGLFSLCGAITYAQLAKLFPVQGGDYVYLSKCFSEKVAFLYGWSRTILIAPGSIAAMSFVFARYASELIFGSRNYPSLVYIALACFCPIIMTVIDLVGLRAGTITQNILTAAKVLGILFISCVALYNSPEYVDIKSDNLTDINWGLALILVLFCYGGWSDISFITNRLEGNSRTLYRSLLISISIVALLYILFSLSLISILGYSHLTSSQTPVTDMAEIVFGGFGPKCISILVCISTLGAIHGMTLTGSYLSATFAKDHKHLSILARTSQGSEVFPNALRFQAILSVVIILLSQSLTTVLLYTGCVTWIFYAATGAALLKLNSKLMSIWQIIIALIFIISCLCVVYCSINYDPKASLITCLFVLLGVLFWSSSHESKQLPIVKI